MMIKRIYKYFIILVLLPLISISQNRDSQIWTNFEVNTEAIHDTELSFNQSFRFTENSRVISRYFSDFKISRIYNKLFSHAIGYRYLLYRDVDDFDIEHNHRFYIDVVFKEKIFKRFNANYRTRLQTQKNPSDAVSKIRQKIKFTYSLNKIDLKLFFSFEGFYIMKNYLEKVRYAFGASKELNKKMKININYMIQKEFNVTDPDLCFVIRTKISYSI